MNVILPDKYNRFDSQEKVLDLPLVKEKEPLPKIPPLQTCKSKFKANSIQDFPKQWKAKIPPVDDPEDDDEHGSDKGSGYGTKKKPSTN